MKRKIVLVILIIVIILGVLCIIDHIKMNNNEPVVFSTWGKKYAPPVENKSEKIVAMYKTIIDKLMENRSALYPTDKYISLDVESLKAPSKDQKEGIALTEKEKNELLEYCQKYHEEVKNLSIEELKIQGYNKGDDTFISLEGALLRVIEIEKLTENKAVIWFQSFHTGLGAIMPKYELNYKKGKWEITSKEMAIS